MKFKQKTGALVSLSYHRKSRVLLVVLLFEFQQKVDVLFGIMQISNKIQNNSVVNFKRSQELATGIKYFIKHQRPDIPEKYLEIQFSTSRIFPSLVTGIVDG